LLDSRSLEVHHPQYQQYRTALERSQGAAAAAASAPRQRQPPQRQRQRRQEQQEQVPESPEAISDADVEEVSPAGAAQAPPPRQLVLRPPPGANGPRCALCALPTLVAPVPAEEGSGGAAEASAAEAAALEEFGGLYGQAFVVHKRQGQPAEGCRCCKEPRACMLEGII
jgi:hypothetical protein